MHTDDEAPLTLSKWPFYLGDLLLVITALAIAILGKWQLSDMQVISCVVSVALGAAIFVLPFVVEYMMRVGEEADDRSSQNHMLKAHLQQVESALQQCHERLTKLESGSGSMDQRCQLLASTMDQKLHTASQGLTTLSQQVGALELYKAEQAEVLAVLQAQFETLSSATQAPDAPSEELVAVQSELAALQTRLIQAVEPLVAVESRLGALEESAKVSAETATAETSEPTETVESEESRPARASRQRRKQNDSGLLHRAIKQKQDAAFTAVNRIIDSKSKLVEPATQPEVSVEPEVKHESEAAVVEAPELLVELDPAEVSAGIEALSEDIEKSSDLFGEAVPPAARRARTTVNDAVFTVSVLIGIGNKPFLRGSGGGLGWEAGVPMDFEEIGKWRWVAPADLEEPVEVQVYRNDEDADRKGRYTLEPGQKLEVSPVF